VTGAAALALPSLASAEVFLSQAQAESNAEHAASQRYGEADYAAACRPQNRNAPRSGYIYKRWVCWWADEYRCEGKLLITGNRGRGYYYHRVLSGQRCP